MKSWLAPLALAAALLAAPPAPADESEGAPPAGSAAGKDWKDHTGDIPFIVGSERGLKEAEFTGKPILYFFTATW
jgi:hypothetical protein